MSSSETPRKDTSSLRKVSPSELKQLLRVGLKSTIHADSLALGLDPDLISGASTDPKWIDVVLDTVLNRRLPEEDPLWEAQVHGTPNDDLITQLLRRCMGWTSPPYAQVDTLLRYVAFPIQRYSPNTAGMRILDTALAAYILSGSRSFPVDSILKLAITSPAAFKHLLPAVMLICKKRLVTQPAQKLVVLDMFSVSFVCPHPKFRELFLWLFIECMRDAAQFERLKRCLELADGGLFGIKVKEYSSSEYQEMIFAALERLGLPPIPILGDGS
ncbi:hypothetical protein FB451DRAFT_1362929 [Mycena latifolia]|nr:hypothetical protein FB451DRAFT_1362929 [Mycena latifolia]